MSLSSVHVILRVPLLGPWFVFNNHLNGFEQETLFCCTWIDHVFPVYPLQYNSLKAWLENITCRQVYNHKHKCTLKLFHMKWLFSTKILWKTLLFTPQNILYLYIDSPLVAGKVMRRDCGRNIFHNLVLKQLFNAKLNVLFLIYIKILWKIA